MLNSVIVYNRQPRSPQQQATAYMHSRRDERSRQDSRSHKESIRHTITRAKMIAKKPPLKFVAVTNVISICSICLVAGVDWQSSSQVAAQVRHLWNPQQPTIYHNQAASTVSKAQEPLGHYAFETAPAMEPPTVRKPPYRPSNELCSGLGEF